MLILLSTYLLCKTNKQTKKPSQPICEDEFLWIFELHVQEVLYARERNDVNNAASSREKQTIASIQTEKAKLIFFQGLEKWHFDAIIPNCLPAGAQLGEMGNETVDIKWIYKGEL